MVSFGSKLRQLRTVAGLSVEQLAQKSGLTAESINGYERGSIVPTLVSWSRIAKALDVPLSVFEGCKLPHHNRSRISFLLAMSGAAMAFCVLGFKVDSIEELSLVRSVNIVIGILFAAAFVFDRLGRSVASSFRASIRMAIMTLSVFTITVGCLELWCETIVQRRWAVSPKTITKNRITVTRAGLYDYARDCSSFPSAQQGLVALINNPGMDGWKGPYVTDDEIVDSWGNQLRFNVVGNRVEVWSV